MKIQCKNMRHYREEEVIFPDDTNIISQNETIWQLTKWLQNYSMSTRTRKVKIHWGEVHIITRKGEHEQLKQQLPTPYNQIKPGTQGKVLGEQIAITTKSIHAVNARLGKAKQPGN